MDKVQQTLIKVADHASLVLTVNKRLARHLHVVYDELMTSQGHKVWPTPQIISLEAWWYKCLGDLGEDWRLLDGFPALRLWEKIIETHGAGTELELLQVTATARKAQEAHRLLLEYGCSVSGSALTEDQKVFLEWRRLYQEECRRQNWLDLGEIPDAVCRALEKGTLAAPQELFLAGFDSYPPGLLRLQQIIGEAGGAVTEFESDFGGEKTAGIFPCLDLHHEIKMAALWTRSLLDQGETSIGIVVPDLQMRKNAIEREFSGQIEPAAALNPAAEETQLSLSLGGPLAEQGPIHAALKILNTGYQLSLDQAGALLRTPYLGGNLKEADWRAQIDLKFRSFRARDLRLSTLASEDGKIPSGNRTARPFEILLSSLADKSQRRPSEWGQILNSLLVEVGWPGDRKLSSREYQMVKAWQEKLIPSLASLDAVSGLVSRQKALSLLSQLAREIEFQIESTTGPVQVVGLLESAGLTFDSIWIMGLTEDVFPAPARPNPFLPVTLQVNQGMPLASAERELIFSRNIVRRLESAGKLVVFSYPQSLGDTQLRPSPLIAALPVIEPKFSKPQDLLSRQRQNLPELLKIIDHQGPALGRKLEQGGTTILKDQALCPFRAFAHHRLRTWGFEDIRQGLDPMTRGHLLHRTLELFWGEVVDQKNFLNLDQETCIQLVKNHIVRALDENLGGKLTSTTLREIEGQRLQELVMEWLYEVEAKRSSFTVVSREQEHFEQIGPLEIKLIIDRVDQLEEGRRVVIDYKTGQSNADDFLAERLLEPQLPIYAVSEIDRPPDGVVIAQVKRGGCRFSGVSRESGLLPKVTGVKENKQALELGLSDWPQLLDHWRQQLELLAEDFVAGKAQVDPVKIEIACRYCDLTSLCRIAEVRGEIVTEDDVA